MLTRSSRKVAKRASAELADLLVQMKITNKLLAAQLRSTMPQIELIALLDSTGATNQEVAETLNTSPGVVATTLTRLRRKRKGQ